MGRARWRLLRRALPAPAVALLLLAPHALAAQISVAVTPSVVRFGSLTGRFDHRALNGTAYWKFGHVDFGLDVGSARLAGSTDTAGGQPRFFESDWWEFGGQARWRYPLAKHLRILGTVGYWHHRGTQRLEPYPQGAHSVRLAWAAPGVGVGLEYFPADRMPVNISAGARMRFVWEVEDGAAGGDLVSLWASLGFR